MVGVVTGTRGRPACWGQAPSSGPPAFAGPGQVSAPAQPSLFRFPWEVRSPVAENKPGGEEGRPLPWVPAAALSPVLLPQEPPRNSSRSLPEPAKARRGCFPWAVSGGAGKTLLVCRPVQGAAEALGASLWADRSHPGLMRRLVGDACPALGHSFKARRHWERCGVAPE